MVTDATTVMAYLQELHDTNGFSKFWAAAGAANATTRATAIKSFFMLSLLSEDWRLAISGRAWTRRG